MELKQISAEDLVVLVRANPLGRFDSPMAGLKWLVKEFKRKAKSMVEMEAACVPYSSLNPSRKHALRYVRAPGTSLIASPVHGPPSLTGFALAKWVERLRPLRDASPASFRSYIRSRNKRASTI
jgi:hypothetical protein